MVMKKVTALRVFSGELKVHYGLPLKGHRYEDGTPVYRLACQGRNVRFGTDVLRDQTVAVTCQKCAGRASKE